MGSSRSGGDYVDTGTPAQELSGGGMVGLDDLPAAQELGADRTMQKPFDCDAVLAAVREVLGD